MICEACLRAPADARLDGRHVCIPCVDLILQGSPMPDDVRVCVHCHEPVRGGRDDPTPQCRRCVEERFDRQAAIEAARHAVVDKAGHSLEDVLPPIDERWRPRKLKPVELSEEQVREQMRELRRAFAETGRIMPPPPPRRSWLDDV